MSNDLKHYDVYVNGEFVCEIQTIAEPLVNDGFQLEGEEFIITGRIWRENETLPDLIAMPFSEWISH